MSRSSTPTQHPPHRHARALVALWALLSLVGFVAMPAASAETLSPISGAGSTYVGIAMRQWVAQGQSQGWKLNYSPFGSPTGMSMYNQGTADFAGTEAEFSSLNLSPSRGYQYVPDVAGATAIMYNVSDGSGRRVDYMHLDRKTIARIFIGSITRWSDPAISATNKGIHFPDQPIRVVLRGNASGTTALFYDFIASTLGSEFASRWTAYQCGAVDVRPVLVQCAKPGFIPSTVSFNDSDQIAQYVSDPNTGKWSIGFDEFGYAKLYSVPTAWVQNASGHYVLPYAQNISAALESAKLRPDLSQDLSGVYSSGNAQSYPVSAYSYMVTQCATTSARPSCKGPYSNAGQTATLGKWMSFIACDGQVTLAAQGYSPLPPNLSQEMANSVARLTGSTPVRLSSSNCANPRFRGSLGAGSISPCDPFSCGARAGSSTGGNSSGTQRATPTASRSSATRAASGSSTSASTAGTTQKGKSVQPVRSGTGGGAAAAGGTNPQQVNGGQVLAVGGGSAASTWRQAQPVVFDGAVPTDPFGSLPAVIVLAAILLPALIGLSVRGAKGRKGPG